MRYHLITYGCQMNQRDSQALANLLDHDGYQASDRPADADILILNTCTVRQHAEDRAISNLGSFLKHKKHRIIGIMGCVAERRQQELLDRFSTLDFVVGPSRFAEIPGIISRIINQKETGLLACGESELHYQPAGITNHVPGVCGWVTIMTGCDNYCAYCIVPSVRGRMQSVPEQYVYQELEQLAKNGYREATLLGQNVNAYGSDLDNNLDFAGLLAEIDRRNCLPRIRFTSSHPGFVDRRFIDIVPGLKTICPHYHLAVQSGSDRVLAAMNRKYTAAEFLDTVDRLRRNRPGCSITSDLIVGYPTEDEAAFQETLSFITAVRFDSMHTFIYSPRAGTAAATLGDPIPAPIKQRRLAEVNHRQQAISQDINDQLVRRTVEVLIEERSPKNPDEYQGRTETNKIVIVKSDTAIIGDLVAVTIERAGSYTLFGRTVP